MPNFRFPGVYYERKRIEAKVWREVAKLVESALSASKKEGVGALYDLHLKVDFRKSMAEDTGD